MVHAGEDQSGERVTQALLSSLGRTLSGGQDWGASIGSSVGANVGAKIDWATSWSHHHLVHRNA
jgi:hypothetical protein